MSDVSNHVNRGVFTSMLLMMILYVYTVCEVSCQWLHCVCRM